jgi:hypothetical protein
MNHVLAASVSVDGAHGVLVLLAALCFLGGAIFALVTIPWPARMWPFLLLLGLLLWSLTGIFH